MSDNIGNRMKLYEKAYSSKCIPLLPICVRLDGRSFSKWTKGLERPFDQKFSDVMVDVTAELVRQSNAVIGYTQSDEITLVLYSDKYESQVFFDGKVQKLISVLASVATVHFNTLIAKYFSQKKLAYFDCRVWQVPNLVEAVNVLVWRELDATKNSITMAASHYYSHKELQNKNSTQKMEMLYSVGVNWNDYLDAFKRGTYIRRVSFETTSERTTGKVLRHKVAPLTQLPKILSWANPVDFIFNGAELQCK